MSFGILCVTKTIYVYFTREVNDMESRRGNEKVQYQGRGRLLKRYLTFMLAVMVVFTSIPLNMAWADDLPYLERPGGDEIELDDSVEEGDLGDIDLDISHTISKKGDKAVITVSAVPSESGQENGVTKITKVEIHQNGKLKKGKRSDDNWEFTVKENGVYSFVIYYNSNNGEDMIVATPSEIEKVEPTTEAEPQAPGANAGGAGGAGGGGATQPGENPDQEVTTPETEEGTTDNPTGDSEGEKENDGTVEGDSDQNTSNEPEQKPSDNTGTDGKEEDKGDTTEDQGGTDSSGQTGNSDNSASDDNNEGNSDSSNSSDNSSDTSSNDNTDSGSSDNSGSDSSGGSDSGSSDSDSSDSSGSSDSGSSDSGSSDHGGSDEGSDSSDTSITFNVIDFIFPVIEAQASDFTVKKAVIVEYEITNLFPEGSPDDVYVDIFDEPTEEGAMITLLAEPSDIGLEKGVREITGISLIDFEPEDDPEIIDSGEISTATDSEAEEELIEEEEVVEEASPSEATHNTSKSSSAKHAEYQASESEEGEYRFFVKENGTYTFSIRYGRAADLDFEDSTELVETQFSTTYELDSIERGVQFTGVEDTTIQAGEAFDLMAGVRAVSDIGMELPVVISDQGGFDPRTPGTYKITYTIATRSVMEGGSAERSIIVNPRTQGGLVISSNIHGNEEGKTLEVPTKTSVNGVLSVTYDLPVGITKRVIKIGVPEYTKVSTWPTSNITRRYGEYIDGLFYTCLEIDDLAQGQITFDIVYSITVGDINVEDYLAADGHVDLGKFHVIGAGIQAGETVDLAEDEIGPVVTSKNTLNTNPNIEAYVSSAYNYRVTYQTFDTVLYDSVSGKVINGPFSINNNNYRSWRISVSPKVNSGYIPYVVNKVRIYAPSHFRFYTTDSAYSAGTDEEGNDYLEVSNKTSSLFKDITVIPKEGIEIKNGTYTAPKYKIYYMGYNGEEKVSEGYGPVYQMIVYNVNYEDVLKVEGQRTFTYMEAETGASYTRNSGNENFDMRISNIATSISANQYILPEWDGQIKASMDYPEELQLQELRFVYSLPVEFNGTQKGIEKVVYHLSDGREIEAVLSGDIAKVPLLDDGVHVDSADIIFTSLYGYQCKVQAGYMVGSLEEEKTVKTTMTVSYDGKEKTAETYYLLKPYAVLDTIHWDSQYGTFNFLQPDSEEIATWATLTYEGRDGGKLIDPQIVINADDVCDQLDGRVRVNLEGFIGGKINYTTSLGEKGECDIVNLGELRYANLKEGEKITEFVLSKKGTVVFPKTSSSYSIERWIYFGIKGVYSEIIEKYGVEQPLTLGGNLVVESENKRFDIETSIRIFLWNTGTFIGMESSLRESTTNTKAVYQGETFNYSWNINGKADGNVSNVNSIPFNPDYYIELINLDKFVFIGTETSDYEIELIEQNGKQYLHVRGNDSVMGSVMNNGLTLQASIPLKFMVLPGAKLGEARPIGKLYTDLNQYSNRSNQILEKYRYKIILDNLVSDEWGITDSGDTTEEHMWASSDSVDEKLGVINIIPQSLATTTIIPGKKEIYSANEVQSFLPSERKRLSALVSMSTGDNAITDYISYIKLPRKGQAVTYSQAGKNERIESEYSIYLAKEPELLGTDIDMSVLYRMEGTDEFIGADDVGGNWHDVAEIKMYTELMPGKRGVSFRLGLEAEDKENIGLGVMGAYMAPEYSQSGNGTLYGGKTTFEYQDFQITGLSWIDNNENGLYDNSEPRSNDSMISLLQNGNAVAQDSYSYSISNGNYTIRTYLYENISLRFDGLDNKKDGIKPTLVKTATNGSTSVFNREGEWTADLPAYFDDNQSGYDLGIIKLPILTVNNTQVGYKSEAQANVSVTNQTNAPAVNSQIIYGEAADTSIATVGFTGLIKGLKENSLTTATASVINSLGDKVTATYQIAVSDNKVPVLAVHPWVAIEGDSIPDLWHDVTAEDPAEEYPAWKTFLLGADKSSRSIPAGNKVVTIYKDSGYTDEIALVDALNAHGLYYMRYSVEDDKENIVTADTTLTVYGKMQGVDTQKHYFETGDTISVPKAEFYYLDVNGAQISVTDSIQTVGPDTWVLNEGPLGAQTQTAKHPAVNVVTEGVTAGKGREVTVAVSGLVDSKIILAFDYPDESVALQNEWLGKYGWDSIWTDYYRHWYGSDNNNFNQVTEIERLAGKDDVVQSGFLVVMDTSVPSVHEYFRTGISPEEYDNVDSDGNPMKNTITEKMKIIVVGKPVVTVPTAIYITPDKIADETFIKDKISASASYHDGTNPTAVIPANQIQYQFNQTGGKNTSVDVTAWGGRADNLSVPVRVEIVTRALPVLTLPDIHLRKDTVYGSENFMDRVLTPADEHNEYTYLQNNLNTNVLGKYEAQYKVYDRLTEAGGNQNQTIYVHGIPEIIATDKSLYAHQSTSEQALIDEVKKSAKAVVVYTKADGTTETKTIPANELQYEVSDYVAGTAGRFKVTITANDKDYVPAGLAPMQVTKEVYVDIADRLFDVTFTTNNDNFHDRGTIDGGAGPVVNSTIYGHTAVIPVPAANDGYHFDGFINLSQTLKATQTLTLSDGTVIAAGARIPFGTMLSIEQVQTIEIYDATRFQAYFSATPILNGKNIKLYVGETYRRTDLNITVSDLDGDAQGIVVDDSHVDTSKAGTYQIKVSVADNDQNQAEEYVYVQVYGKTKLEGYDPIHIRQGQTLSVAQLTGAIKATYEAPPAVPDSPWNVTSQPAVLEEVTFDLTGVIDTQVIALTKLTISAKGQIEGREADGGASAEKAVFVHGNPIITANDGTLYTHESTSQTVLTDLIKQNAAASIKYVEPDGSIRTETIAANKLNYEIKPGENYQPRTEGTYKVTISFNDTNYVPTGLQPADAELLAAVIVSDKAYSVKFTINNDNAHHKGDYEGGISEFNTNAIHGNPVGRVPVPVEASGYHFDGFKTLTAFTTTDDIQLANGSTILAGTPIPVGTMLTPAQLESLKIYDNLEFQAYFSASPVIKGDNVVLYVNEAYDQSNLHIEVTDLDENAQLPVIDDGHVNTGVAGTYQVKVTVKDADENQTVKYLYVQVVGKTEFIHIPDLHIRKDTTATEELLVADVKAVYAKPEEIPEEPWADSNKINNGHAAISTEVATHSNDVVNTSTIRKDTINLSALGMIRGREMIGKADAVRALYIHGVPVIVAYDNGIHTHESTSDTVLEQIVQTGIGNLTRDPASAYVEYVKPDGTINKVTIDPNYITFRVDQYIPLTAGNYLVTATVDDFSVIAQAPGGLTAVTGERTNTVVVADKMYSVMFEMGEHGGLEDPTKNVIAVAHGKKVPSPILAPEEGYKLDYWVDEAGNRISDISSVVVTANRKFTAEFKLKEFTVRFIGKNNRVIKTEIVKYGHDATPPTEDKDVTNKRFDGWSTSYTNITEDTDIYTKYWKKSGGGGPNGGGGFVPSGPGMQTTITEPSVPKNPFENLVEIGTNPVPTGNTEIPVYTGLPKTGDVSEGIKANIGYQATLIDGTVALLEDEPLVGQHNGSLLHVFEEHADWRRCILHMILLIISALEGIFYLFKRRRDRRLLEKLRRELEEEDK